MYKKYQFLPLGIFLVSSLTSCVGVALLGTGAAVGGIVVSDRRNASVILADQNLASKIGKMISANAELREMSHVVVTSFNRSVLIVGQTPRADLKEQVTAMVRAIPHVRQVYNEIIIAAPTSTITQANDAWITTKVKTMLLGRENLQSGQIKVLTESGSVYLLGIVTPAQAEEAVEVTRKVDGVQKVVKLFEYTAL